MRTKLTGSLAVCVAAAVFTAGALVLNNDSPGPAPVAAASDGATVAAGTRRLPHGGRADRARPPPPRPAPATLEIKGLAFGPVTAGRGGRVSVQSRDGVPHTVTADNGAFDSGRIGPNGTATIVAPAAPGSYRFTCLIHPQMVGTLVVR